MDASIRSRNPVAMPSPGRRTTTLRSTPIFTVIALRKAILNCAHQATAAEPTDTDRRLHSFIAKLSGTMEGLGERELDAVLWNLMSTEPAAQQVGP
ncbi:hypothetical protein ACHAC9_22210 [Massilia sp. CMS3.1]|uniref:hypothetical protein n=1 Tax=Massilia sp. CMS3.1 TaxID=3373083 RepID=UPI003EE59C2E